jgi:hypothetical protein
LFALPLRPERSNVDLTGTTAHDLRECATRGEPQRRRSAGARTGLGLIAHTAIAGVENNNQEDPSIPGYPATQGWDPVTGLGTPNAAALIPDLVDAAHS